MAKDGYFNQQARRSGGYRRPVFDPLNITPDDLEILRQEAEIRREFGEEGVRLFWERIPREEQSQ